MSIFLSLTLVVTALAITVTGNQKSSSGIHVDQDFSELSWQIPERTYRDDRNGINIDKGKFQQLPNDGSTESANGHTRRDSDVVGLKTTGYRTGNENDDDTRGQSEAFEESLVDTKNDKPQQTADSSTESWGGHHASNNMPKLPPTRGGPGQVKSGSAVEIEPATSEGHPDVTLPTWWTEGDLPGYDLGYRSLLGHILDLTPEVDPGPPGRACPCSNATWCRPVNRTVTSEVFSFRVQNKNKTLDYLGYDWSRLSTVALMKHVDDDVMCAAHSHNVRLIYTDTYAGSKLLNPTARSKWVAAMTAVVVNNFFDGFHLDFEDFVNNQARRKALNELFSGVVKSIKQHLPSAQITIDITFSPDVPHHAYDYVTLLKVADFAFLRLYGQRRHVITPQCIAWAMSTNDVTLQGVKKYEKLGIPGNKLILGFGWYGFDFPCAKYHNGTCFRELIAGKCSYTDIITHSYEKIVYFLKDNPTIKPTWVPTAGSHRFEYKDAHGKIRQVWYNDVQSLRMRYPLAAQHGLRGVGMWDLDMLDYSNTQMAADMRREMFGAVPRPGLA